MESNIKQEAAQSLLDRAKDTSKSSEAYMLIDSAKRLNPTLDIDSIKRAWDEKWMKEQRILRGV
jgi:hypothetical protein